MAFGFYGPPCGGGSFSRACHGNHDEFGERHPVTPRAFLQRSLPETLGRTQDSLLNTLPCNIADPLPCTPQGHSLVKRYDSPRRCPKTPSCFGSGPFPHRPVWSHVLEPATLTTLSRSTSFHQTPRTGSTSLSPGTFKEAFWLVWPRVEDFKRKHPPVVLPSGKKKRGIFLQTSIGDS